MPDDTAQATLLGRVEGRLDQGFKDIGHRLDSMANESSLLRQILDTLRTSVATQDSRLATVERQIGEMQKAKEQAAQAQAVAGRERRTSRREWIFGICGAAIGIGSAIGLLWPLVFHHAHA